MEQAIKLSSNPMIDRPVPDKDLTGATMGDYQILRRLGQGGMGEVYLAEQISLKRKVALKLLKPELAANERSLERFKREAESVARATHANIVQVYAIGEALGHHFMALEYVEGRNLREFLEKKGPPEIFLGLRIVSQVAAALHRASELGIVHRDIKPENILLTRKGEVKVADFGLTRVLDESAPAQPTHLTQSGVTMGTPLYMSPEQVEGKRDIDPRSDIYSLGVTAYHLFAGQPPFRGASPFEVAVQHVQNEPQPLGEIRPDLPAELCAVVHKMMAKKPEDRFQTGREIVREVSRLRDALVGVTAGVTAMSLGLSRSGQVESLLAVSGSQAMPPSSSKHRRRWIVTGSILVALAGGLLVGWLLAPSDPSPASASNQYSNLDDGGKSKALVLFQKQEKTLLEASQKYSQPKAGEWIKGLQAQADLGVFYLKEKHWDDADRFFKELEATQKNPPYKMLGHLGRAIVLSFQDKPQESNQLFEKWVESDKFPREKASFGGVARLSPGISEMIAKALQRNHANAPASFPPSLEKYRMPPAPTLKTPPANGGG